MLDRVASRRALAASLFAFSCGVVVFARSVAFGFVYDDHWTIEGSPLDAPFFGLMSSLFRGAGRAHGVPDATRPMMVASMWVDHALFGDVAAGYHVDSVLIYGLVCALVLWVSFWLTSRLRVAVVAAALFALAPLHTEVVCAINYREDLLASIGVLVPLLCLVRPGRATRLSEGLAVGAFAFGLFAKESAVVLVPIAVVVAAISEKARARMLAKREILFGLAAVLVVWTLWRGGLAVSGDDVPRARFSSMTARLLASARFFVRTGLDTLLPVRATPEHAREGPASAAWALALAAWIACVVFLARRRATRILALGLAIVIVAPSPASPLFAPANEMADRYAFLGVLGAGLVWGGLASRVPSRLAVPAVIAAGVALSFSSQVACASWRSDRALWSTAVACAPTSPRAWVGLSRACRLDGDLDAADRDVDRALALDPKFIAAHVTRTYNLLWRGDVTEAQRELAVIHALGGSRHAGVAKAVECAALPPERASTCIR